MAYNEERGIEPASVIKAVDSDLVKMANLDYVDFGVNLSKKTKLDLAGEEDLDKAFARIFA